MTIEELTTALSEGKSVTIKGLGTFKIADRAAKAGRNPKTGEALTIPAHRTVTFKVAPSIKSALNQ